MADAQQQHFLALEERLRIAMIASDVHALDALLDDDLVFTSHFGTPMGKAEDLGAHEAGLLKIAAIEGRDWIVRPLGDDVGIVSVEVDIVGAFAGIVANGTFRFMRVWARADDGAWRLVAAQSTLVQQRTPA